jgi:hypothetical protein
MASTVKVSELAMIATATTSTPYSMSLSVSGMAVGGDHMQTRRGSLGRDLAQGDQLGVINCEPDGQGAIRGEQPAQLRVGAVPNLGVDLLRDRMEQMLA